MISRTLLVIWKAIVSMNSRHWAAQSSRSSSLGSSKSDESPYRDTFYDRCHTRKRLDNGEKCNFTGSIRQDQLNAEVEQIVLDMVHDQAFRDFITKKMEETIDVSSLETERKNLRDQLRQAEGSKRKLTEQMDKLDVTDVLIFFLPPVMLCN